MKLVGCPLCNDIIALTQWKKSCKCGHVYGKYLPDGIRARISPEAVPLACDTNKLVWIDGELLRRLTFEINEVPHNGHDIEVGHFEE